MRKLIPFFILGLFIISSCNQGKVYEKYFDIERITWNRFDVKTFEVDIKDISSHYDFYIVIRHHTDIPFKFITARFTMITPSGEERVLEQKILLKDKDGKLLGDGMGDLWDVVHPARKDFQFTDPGICKVEISSTMSQADLPGIMQVGLIVKKSP
jgi:gliding motility-associated lipoprotein GldH